MAALAPSILSADFTRLGEQVALIGASGAERIHVDIMDGHFVPNITFGPMVLSAIRPCSPLPMDVHLMVTEPERLIEAFVKAGADSITFHAEATPHADRLLRDIRSTGKLAGISLNPGTPLGTLEHLLPLADIVLLMTVNPGFGGQSYIPYMTGKIATLRQRINAEGLSTRIHVDGGIGLANAAEVAGAGADVLVAGNAFFTSPDPSGFVQDMKRLTTLSGQSIGKASS